MRPRIRKLLQDVIVAAESLPGHVAGATYEEYLANRTIRLAVEREFEILGEALRQIGDEDPAVLERIEGARRFIGFRNVLAHRYAQVDPVVAWGTIESAVPILVRQVRVLLAEVGDG